MSKAFEEGDIDLIKLLIRFDEAQIPNCYLGVLLSIMQKKDPKLTFLVASSTLENFNILRKAINLEYAQKWSWLLKNEVRNFFDKPLSLKALCRININRYAKDVNSLLLPTSMKEFVKFNDF